MHDAELRTVRTTNDGINPRLEHTTCHLFNLRLTTDKKMNEEAENRALKNLQYFIQEEKWNLVRARCQDHPEEFRFVDTFSGLTLLHQLCFKTITPLDVFQMVVNVCPEATKIQDRRYGSTPLHILCLNSQRSIGKVDLVLLCMEPENLLIKNVAGDTALHIACEMNAMLPVIKSLVQKNPDVLFEKNRYDRTAFSPLRRHYFHSIPGHLAIIRLLKGEDVQDGHFERFWEKLEYFVHESFRQHSPYCPKDTDRNDSSFLIHGLLQFQPNVLDTYKIALKQRPDSFAVADAAGNYPLHRAILLDLSGPFILEILHAYPEAASVRNKDGDLPLFLAIRQRIGWKQGLGEIVKADTDILASQDKETSLFPFLLAASIDGDTAVDTAYQLLCAKPYLVREAIK
jgi:ankyrin repeat protein